MVNFRRARTVEKGECTTLVPCTEGSGGRSGTKPVNHPLCDKLQYVAADFSRFGGQVTSGFAKEPEEPHRAYMNTLLGWARSNHKHSKLDAILTYLQKGQVVGDLVRNHVLPVNDPGAEQPNLLKNWIGDKAQAPPIFKVLPNGQSPEDALVRWRVEEPEKPASGTWEDQEMIASWISYYESLQSKFGLCMVNGCETTLAEQHPAKLRNGADKAKLVSSNDKNGYTFRGRFVDAEQAVGIGFDATQKAHNALRWLIARQGYRNGDQVIVAWAVSGKDIPDPFRNTLDLFGVEGPAVEDEALNVGDVGQAFARRLNRAISGYRAKLGTADEIVIMGLDSATPGRMAISFYRELNGFEFLDRVQNWHEQCAWPQNFGKDSHFIGAPAPRDIAEAAFGKRLDDKLKKSTIERLLPCIVDGRPIPADFVASTTRRASNRVGLDHWDWEKCLGIACALFRGHHKQKGYQMSLESKRATRDYLYGRLLAVAEQIEDRALYIAGENRSTTAARLMQRFADRPLSTWKTIELALGPYKARLRGSRGPFLRKMEKLVDDITAAFDKDDFVADGPLSGEFLLGYHCQRRDLHSPAQSLEDEQHPDE